MDLEKLLKERINLTQVGICSESRDYLICLQEGDNYRITSYNLDTGKTDTITSGTGYCRDMQCSPNGNRLLLSMGGKDRAVGALYLIEGGVTKKIASNVGDRSFIAWAPDSRSIYYVYQHCSIKKLCLQSLEDEILYQTDSVIWGLAISPSEKIMMFSEGLYGHLQMRCHDLDEGITKTVTQECITVEPSCIRNTIFSHDSKMFAFAGITDDSLDIGLLNLSDYSVKWILTEGGYRKIPLAFSPTGEKLLYGELDKARYALKVYNLARASVDDLSIGTTKSHTFSLWISEDEILTICQDFDSLNEFWIASKYEKHRIEIMECPDISIEDFVKPEEVSYTTFDGILISGLLFKSKTGSMKSLIGLHGGPQVHRHIGWDPLSQFLSYHGFNVFWPDYRGSSGDGIYFENLNDGDLGGGDAKDVVWAAKWLNNNGLAETGNIGLFGSSYGGYLTLMTLGKYPEFWKAGICIAGLWDLVSTYRRNHPVIRRFLEKKLGVLDENLNLYRERSPITHLHRAQANCMIFHGRQDPRCPIDGLSVVAEKLGNRCTTVIYDDESHSVVKEKNRLDMYRKMCVFLSKELSG